MVAFEADKKLKLGKYLGISAIPSTEKGLWDPVKYLSHVADLVLKWSWTSSFKSLVIEIIQLSLKTLFSWTGLLINLVDFIHSWVSVWELAYVKDIFAHC